MKQGISCIYNDIDSFLSDHLSYNANHLTNILSNSE